MAQKSRKNYHLTQNQKLHRLDWKIFFEKTLKGAKPSGYSSESDLNWFKEIRKKGYFMTCFLEIRNSNLKFYLKYKFTFIIAAE